MQLFFQSGDSITQGSDEIFFSWLNLLVTFFGIIAGALVALFVFWKAEKIKEAAERQRLADIEEYLLGYLRDLSIPFDRQASFFLEAAASITAPLATGYIFQYASTLTTDDVEWINKADLYNIIVKNKIGDNRLKTELLRKLNGHLAFLSTVKPDFVELKQEFMDLHKAYEKDWSTNIKGLGRVKDRLISNHERVLAERKTVNAEEVIKDDFLDAIVDLVVKWSSIPNQLVQTVAMVHFINPLIDVCSKYIARPESIEFMNHATECRDAFNNIEALKSFNAMRLTGRSTVLIETKIAFHEIAMQIMSMKRKKL